MRQVKSFDFDALGERERYKLLIGTVVPRPFAPTVDELVEAGLTAVPGRRAATPWIGEAPAALECRRYPPIHRPAGRRLQEALG